MKKIVIPELEELIGTYQPRSRAWDDEQTAILEAYYRKVDDVALAKYLQRSVDAVVMKARRMGL